MKSDKKSSVFTLIGASILFTTFGFTKTGIIELAGTAGNFRSSLGPANIWFSMAASTLGIYIGSVIVNNSRVGIREASFGVITGAVISGVGAGFIENIGALLLLGLIAGFAVGAMSNKIDSMNKEHVKDSQGFLVPTLLVSFLGGFIGFPCILIAHVNGGSY